MIREGTDPVGAVLARDKGTASLSIDHRNLIAGKHRSHNESDSIRRAVQSLQTKPRNHAVQVNSQARQLAAGSAGLRSTVG